MSDTTCFYCGKTFEPDDLRPYGPGGAMVDYDCANATPERQATTHKAMGAAMDAAEATSPVGKMAVTESGPQPYDPSRAEDYEYIIFRPHEEGT